MGTFKAIRVDKADKGTTVALTQFDEAELMEGDVTVAVEYSTLELQGRPCRHRQGAGGAALSDDRGHRLRRHRGAVVASAVEGRRQGDLHRLGHGRDPSRRYAEKARVKGDWLVRLPGTMSTRDAMAIGTAGFTAMLVGAGAGKAWPDAEKRSCRRHRRRRRRRLGRHRRAVETRLSRHRLDRPRCRRPIT